MDKKQDKKIFQVFGWLKVDGYPVERIIVDRIFDTYENAQKYIDEIESVIARSNDNLRWQINMMYVKADV
jgi:viroplasmin and RNaseH domain-containing protein